MALFHQATLTPSKADLLAAWVPDQRWAPSGDLEVLGAFRFDDPDGQVGIETHMVRVAGTVLHLPLTYRPAPLDDDAGLVTEMHHSALGTRWVYDGVHDPLYLVMVAAVAMTGQGEALGMVQYDGVWHVAPAAIKLTGGGWSQTRVNVDGFVVENPSAETVIARNGGFELSVHRQPLAISRPPLGLAAYGGPLSSPVVVATVAELGDSKG